MCLQSSGMRCSLEKMICVHFRASEEFSTAVKAHPLQKAGLWASATENTHTPQTPKTP